MSIFNFDRLLLRRLRRESSHELDQARYLSVTTGRMEPYLRQLAITPLFAYRIDDTSPTRTSQRRTAPSDTLHHCSSEGRILRGSSAAREAAPQDAPPDDTHPQDTAPQESLPPLYSTCHDNVLFVHAYTTALRLECDLNNLLHPDYDMRTSGGFDSSLHFQGSFQRAHIVPITAGSLTRAFIEHNTGVRIDAHSDNELTVESHQLPVLADLCAHKPVVQAFTAIGTEELLASSPVGTDSSDMAFSQALQAVAKRFSPSTAFLGFVRCNVELKGFRRSHVARLFCDYATRTSV